MGPPWHSQLLQSYTSSPLDPNARLFYNPAYNDEAIPRMSDSKSVLRWGRAQQWQAGHATALASGGGEASRPRLQPAPAMSKPSLPLESRPCSASHVPKPGYLRRLPSSALVSMEPSSLQPPTATASEGQQAAEGAIVVAAAVAAEAAAGPAGRRLQPLNQSIESSLDTRTRR